MSGRAVVVFLFAQEKLLFRYPLHNPFTIDISNANNQSSGHTGAVEAGGYAKTKTTKCSSETLDVIAVPPTAATQQHSQQQQQQQQQQQSAMSTSATRVGVRHKPRTAWRPQPTTSTTADGKHVFNDDNSGPVRAPSHTVVPSSPALTASLLAGTAVASTLHHGYSDGSNKTEMKGDGSETKGAADTCVGVQTTVLLHLLRASFSTCTTIQFAGGTFLIYPLFPSRVKSRSLRTSGALRFSDTSADDVVVDEEEKKKRGNSDASGEPACSSLNVVLVVAMNHPDRDDCAIANFVQIFMNVLVREELRSHYVTDQVLQMERKLYAWEMGDNNAISARRDANRSPCGGGSSRLSEEEMFTELLRDTQLSLCTEIFQLAQHIAASDCDESGRDTMVSAHLSASGPSSLPSSYRRMGVGANNSGNRTGGGNGGSVNVTFGASGASEFVVRGLFRMPVASILGRHGPPSSYHATDYVKQNSNSVVTLNDPNFVERLAKPYMELVGRRAVQLLPLSTVRAVLNNLSPPWRIGALYRALEQVLATALQQHQAVKVQQQQQQQAQPQSTPLSSKNSTVRVAWIPMEERFAHEGGIFLAVDENPVPDCDALIVEVVEFLRLSGALRIITELTVVFTHGDLFPATGISCWSRRHKESCDAHVSPCPEAPAAKHVASFQERTALRSKLSSQVAPASMIGVMVLEGLRMASNSTAGSCSAFCTPFFGAEEVPDAALLAATTPPQPPMITSPSRLVSFTSFAPGGGNVPHFDVYCAWGNACPICEELASAPHAWRVGGVSVRLSFPFLSPSVADAAMRRGLQNTRSIDPECCRLVTDQRPWFTQPDTFTTPSIAPDKITPVQFYRHLTRSHGDAGGQRAKGDSPPLECCTTPGGGESERDNADGNDTITALTPDAIPKEAKEWLSANYDVIRSRILAARQQRRSVEESTTKLAELHSCTATVEGINLRMDISSDNIQQQVQQQQQQQQQQQKKHVLRPNQRYHKRKILSNSVPPGSAEPLLSSPVLLPTSHALLSPPSSHYAAGNHTFSFDEQPTGSASAASFETLMQFAFHHIVALLWGKSGISVETLLRLLERNLRRLPSFLGHAALRPSLCVPHKTEQSFLSSFSTGFFDKHERQTKRKETNEKDEAKEMPSTLQRQLQEAAVVFAELSLMDVLRQMSEMAVEVVPTRLLLHTVVNAFSDVLLIGGTESSNGNNAVLFSTRR